MDAKQIVQKFFDEQQNDCSIEKVTEFNGFTIVTCKWWAQVGPHEIFDLIVKEGKIYNKNFDDIIEISNDANI